MIHNYSKETMQKTGVYKITCLVNNKFYVGSASCRRSSPSKIGFLGRLNQHIQTLRGNRHCNMVLQNSYNKYSEDSFIFEILEFCEPDKCFEREQFYLDMLQPFYPKGFNICKNALQNKTNHGKVRTCSRDVTDLNSSQRIPVIQKDLNGDLVKEFSGVALAARETGVHRVAIYKCCRKEYKTAGGFLWEYKEPSNNIKYRYSPKLPIKVTNIKDNTFKIYGSIEEICRDLDYCRKTIQLHCKNSLILGNKYRLEKIISKD